MGLTRRELVLGGAATAVVYAIESNLPARALAGAMNTDIPPRIVDIYGLHDAPFDGGSPILGKAEEDLRNFKVNWLVSIEPTDLILEILRRLEIRPITRINSEKNLFNEQAIIHAQQRVMRYFNGPPPVQPFNETNLPIYTGYVFMPPEVHIKLDFIPAAETIARNGGIPILTPPAPRASVAGYTTVEYLEGMARELVRKGRSWILENNIALGLHPYTFAPGADPFEDILALDLAFSNIVEEQLPIYVTEAGLLEDTEFGRHFTEEDVAEDTVKILGSTIPEPIRGRLRAYNFWIYASKAQRTPNIPIGDADKYERASWVRQDGYRLVAHKVIEYVGKIYEAGKIHS